MSKAWGPPAAIGMTVEEVDTPALIVELDRFEANLERMAHLARERGVALRPHAKMHKCTAVARRQMALGAAGICCQKTSEAIAMVEGGIADVLISNEVVGTQKIARLVALARVGRIGVCIDNAQNATALSAAATAAGVTLDVYIDLDVGARRCGVAPGAPALVLAHAAAALPGLRLMGLQAYHGAAQHLRSAAEREAAIAAAAPMAAATRDAMLAAGLPCPVITGAGTGTCAIEAASSVYTELQAGSYAFMDADYGRNRDGVAFAQSLFILATVMSCFEDRAVLDVGLKAHSIDSGMPLVHADAAGTPLAGLEYIKATDEHGVIVATGQANGGAALPALGAKLRLIPGHIDPTVNLHDWLIGVREGHVTEIWPIEARGAMW